MPVEGGLARATGDSGVVTDPGKPGNHPASLFEVETNLILADHLEKLLLGRAAANDDDDFHFGHRSAGFVAHLALEVAMDPYWNAVDEDLLARAHCRCSRCVSR